MKSQLFEIVNKQGKDRTLFLFYGDILNGCKNPDDSRIVQLLRNDFKFELLLRNLDLKRQLKIRNTKNEMDRFVKLVNMIILRFVLEQYEGLTNSKEIEEGRNKYGKPFLKNRDYQFNISDEENLVCLAIGFDERFKNDEIGIDLADPTDIEEFKLEKLEDFYRTDFRAIFGCEEVEWMDYIFPQLTYKKQLELLSHIWALKESYCKYIGIGITAGMEKFQFPHCRDIVNVENQIDDYCHADTNYFKIEAHNIKMEHIEGYGPYNVCFKIPNSRFICSVFGHYSEVSLIKINIEKLIYQFIEK